MTDSSSDMLRREIAAAAARLIADSGLDYVSAKRKAARQLLGDAAARKVSTPDNDEVDAALREHLALFDDNHAERVERRRRVAAALMRRLEAFRPFLTGAVWKGIVAEHAPIHLQLFHDNPKDVAIHLLNDGIRFDVETTAHFRDARRDEVEAIVFWWHDEPVLLSLYDEDDLRGALRGGPAGAERGDLAALLGRLQTPADTRRLVPGASQ
ncbi:MAG: UDP-N-acetylmuramate--alanine ligase [Burkholderiaceae bacterium]